MIHFIKSIMKPVLTFIIPAKDEESSVEILYINIVEVVKKLKKTFEIIFIDDGSTDNTFKILTKISRHDKRVKIIKHRGNFGKSIALQNGFDYARGSIIFTLDADLQDDPKEIPNFLKKISEGYDLVSGWKFKRFDPISKTFPSKIGNWLTRRLTGVKIHDLNCGYKAYRKEAAKSLNLYGELYKFIPVLTSKEKFKVTEIPIHHKARKFGKSKYGWGRNLKGLTDIITVVFLSSYVSKPGQFFGGSGIISFLIGFLIGAYITYIRITTGTIQYRTPLLFLGILLMVIGIQLISTGLLAEMILYSRQKFDYKSSIQEII